MTAPEPHTLLTRALFVDAIVGVGFPTYAVALHAERGGLATDKGSVSGPQYEWNRRILETLTTETLQEMYCALKAHDAS